MADETSAELLATGKAFADLSYWRKVAVSGSDALDWLDDLVTADLSDLAAGGARQSLFLSPTGGLRASFTVALPDDTLLLIQDPGEPVPIDQLLGLYVLSSDVVLEDQTDEFVMFAFPGANEAPDVPGTNHSRPSVLGSGAGADLVGPGRDHDLLLDSLSKTYAHAGNEDVEAWRIAAGVPRLGVDALQGDLPQESGLYGAVSREKGCFPGQEAVAKVDSLGHPRRVVLAMEADGPASAGDPVMLDGSEVGQVTSAAIDGQRTLLLARLRWEARDARLHTALGTELRLRSQQTSFDSGVRAP
jgi:tRNA-modifying protein YgfZ